MLDIRKPIRRPGAKVSQLRVAPSSNAKAMGGKLCHRAKDPNTGRSKREAKYVNLIHNTIVDLNARKGCSAMTIRKNIEQLHASRLGPNFKQELGSTLKKLARNGKLVRNGHNFQVAAGFRGGASNRRRRFARRRVHRRKQQKRPRKVVQPRKYGRRRAAPGPKRRRRCYNDRRSQRRRYSQSSPSDSSSASEASESGCSKSGRKRRRKSCSSLGSGTQSPSAGSIRASAPPSMHQSPDTSQVNPMGEQYELNVPQACYETPDPQPMELPGAPPKGKPHTDEKPNGEEDVQITCENQLASEPGYFQRSQTWMEDLETTFNGTEENMFRPRHSSC